ncbi:hypothetical protein AYI72_22395 [Shewanella algae]|nr:hypothetical protein AYI72_22395 [Shewanella algae]
MSVEQSLSNAVQACNNLTAAVNNKMSEIDAEVDQQVVRINNELASLNSRLPRILVSQNFLMLDADSNGLPDNWGFNSELSLELVNTIINASQATGRPQDDVDLLVEIENDVKEIYPDFDIRESQYYRSNFNVWQMSWATRNASTYLAYPYAADQTSSAGAVAVPQNSYLTLGAFVKVIDGNISGQWANGAVVGKWRWCSTVISPSKSFGTYSHLHPYRDTASGVVQVALAGACTGVVTHPGEWFAMMQL